MKPIHRFAIFGGPPEFPEPLHVNRPNAGDREYFEKLTDGIWESKWFTNDGPLVQRLEQELENLLGVRNCVLMSSGTMAMAVLVRALGLSGEVILPSFTFVSTAHVLQWAGIVPVFCDIKPDTWNADPTCCEALIGDRTEAIIATHLWGRMCDVQDFQALADGAGLSLIFDAGHAFGCSHNNVPIGRFGDAEVFSFHATKPLHFGEGGGVTTQDDCLAAKLRKIRTFGFTGFDSVECVGTNAKLPELSAALGLSNLRTFDANMAKSRENYRCYCEALAPIPSINLREYPNPDAYNCHYICVELDGDCALNRDDIVRILHAENVLARRYFYPGCHNLEPYRRLYAGLDKELPVTTHATARVIVLPGGAGISTEEILAVCQLLGRILANSAELKPRLDNGTSL